MSAALPAAPHEPHRDCAICPRLHDFIAEWRRREPGWFNAPVPTFEAADGPESVAVLIVGLAPGLRGANRTGRPFTGDYAGDLLYSTLRRFGFSRGEFQARPDDGVELIGTALTNAVRCVPPLNRPLPEEIRRCLPYLRHDLAVQPAPGVVLALGRVAHEAVLRALDLPLASHPFGHGARARLPGGRTLLSSYHCSRYNTSTGRLTAAMFRAVVAEARESVDCRG